MERRGIGVVNTDRKLFEIALKKKKREDSLYSSIDNINKTIEKQSKQISIIKNILDELVLEFNNK